MQEIHRRIRFSVIAGAFLSLTGYFGFKFASAVFNYEKVTYEAPDFVFPVTLTFILSVVIYLFLGLTVKWKESKKFNLKRWHIFVPLVIVSLILLITMYPGFFPYDSVMMYEAYDSGQYTNHYSPFISFILGLTISLGKFLWSTNFGHAIFILFQFVFVDIALTETIYYCSKKLNKKSFGIISLLFFIIHPLFQIMQIRSGQDTIFAGLFILICLEFLKISEDENYFNKKIKYVYIVVLLLLFFMTRNNGLYAAIPALLAGFFTLKNKINLKKLYITLSIPIVLFLGYQLLFINNVVYQKDSFYKETLNVPLMQIARSVYISQDKDIENELNEYFYEGCADWRGVTFNWYYYIYSSGISDPYKDCMNTEVIEKDPIKFFSLWTKIGTKYPVEYIEAPAIFMLGLYYPFLPYEPHGKVFYQWHLYIDSFTTDFSDYGISGVKFTKPMKKIADELFYWQHWSKIPVLNLLWRAPITFFLCILTILYTLYKRKYHYLFPLSLIFGLILTVFLSPVLLFRYLLPAVLSMPIMVYIFMKSMVK